MRADSLIGQIVSVLSRRAPAFRPRQGEKIGLAAHLYSWGSLRRRPDKLLRNPGTAHPERGGRYDGLIVGHAPLPHARQVAASPVEAVLVRRFLLGLCIITGLLIGWGSIAPDIAESPQGPPSAVPEEYIGYWTGEAGESSIVERVNVSLRPRELGDRVGTVVVGFSGDRPECTVDLFLSRVGDKYITLTGVSNPWSAAQEFCPEGIIHVLLEQVDKDSMLYTADGINVVVHRQSRLPGKE
ncbi:hypothetical protein [Streptomyces mangrovi]|uniref:hypothetical protein n=1 Tax=Streptomyces mangrovi TaxID=1206892 RepID=UPI00399D3880